MFERMTMRNCRVECVEERAGMEGYGLPRGGGGGSGAVEAATGCLHLVCSFGCEVLVVETPMTARVTWLWANRKSVQ